jgi:crossover junction endodeoxyribonuclease RuvC
VNTNDTTTRILGIDPGLNTTGYGVIDVKGNSLSLVEGGVVRSRRTDTLSVRLKSLHDGITDVVQSLKPDGISIEQLYSHYERPRTAILMGHARGVLVLAASQNEIPLYDYAATQVKRLLTGSGRAPKNQVQFAVMHQLGLAEPPEPNDIADALAIAMCHWFQSRADRLELRNLNTR